MLLVVMNVKTSSPVNIMPIEIQTLSTVGNQTMSTSNSYFWHTETDWIVPIIINSFMIVITTWMLISLVHYGIKTQKWRFFRRESAADLLNKGAVYTSVIMCGVTTLLYHILAVVYLNIGFDKSDFSHKLCEAISDVSSTVYALVLFSVALFLWLRQRAFYNNPIISVNYSKFAKVVSSISFGVILFGGIGVLIFISYPSDYKSSAVGCIYVPDEKLKLAYWLSVATVVILAHGVFVGLFVYALKMIRRPGFKASSSYDPDKASKKSTIADDTKVRGNQPISSSRISEVNSSKSIPKPGSSSNSNRSSKHRIKSILLKTIIFAVLSSMMDVFVQILSVYITKPGNHRGFVITMISASTLFNFLFLILSFDCYQSMLTSPWRFRR